jgi:hypothetical protein
MSATRIALALFLGVVSVSLTTAVASSQDLPNSTVSIDRAVIGCQVREAIALGGRARARLESQTGAEDLGAAHKLLETMYRQVRLALGNLNDRRERVKPRDPMLDLEVAKITSAWNSIRRPVDGFFNSPEKDEWLAGAGRDLRVAMSALRQAEVMLPLCTSSRSFQRDGGS